MRARLILCTLVLTLAAVTAPSLASTVGPALAQEPEDSAQACQACHEDLLEALPEDHPSLTLSDLTYCLPCHGALGAARGLVWITHLNHYGQDDFPGDCLSCHLVADGEVTLIGAPTDPAEAEDDEATPEAEDVAATREPSPTAASASPTVRPTRTPRPTPTPRPVDEEWALEMTEYFQSWASSEFADHTHAQASVTCDQCHDTFFPEKKPATDACLRCHGTYTHLAELTEPEVEGPNPHASHLGEPSCTSCHNAHEEAELMCLQCHIFELEMPEWDED